MDSRTATIEIGDIGDAKDKRDFCSDIPQCKDRQRNNSEPDDHEENIPDPEPEITVAYRIKDYVTHRQPIQHKTKIMRQVLMNIES